MLDLCSLKLLQARPRATMAEEQPDSVAILVPVIPKAYDNLPAEAPKELPKINLNLF